MKTIIKTNDMNKDLKNNKKPKRKQPYFCKNIGLNF